MVDCFLLIDAEKNSKWIICLINLSWGFFYDQTNAKINDVGKKKKLDSRIFFGSMSMEQDHWLMSGDFYSSLLSSSSSWRISSMIKYISSSLFFLIYDETFIQMFIHVLKLSIWNHDEWFLRKSFRLFFILTSSNLSNFHSLNLIFWWTSDLPVGC